MFSRPLALTPPPLGFTLSSHKTFQTQTDCVAQRMATHFTVKDIREYRLIAFRALTSIKQYNHICVCFFAYAYTHAHTHSKPKLLYLIALPGKRQRCDAHQCEEHIFDISRRWISRCVWRLIEKSSQFMVKREGKLAHFIAHLKHVCVAHIIFRSRGIDNMRYKCYMDFKRRNVCRVVQHNPFRSGAWNEQHFAITVN